MSMVPESEFLIRVVHKSSGDAVQWAPGLSVEKEFIQELCNRLAAKGVGYGRSTAHVLVDLQAALEELFQDLKSQVHYGPHPNDWRK